MIDDPLPTICFRLLMAFFFAWLGVSIGLPGGGRWTIVRMRLVHPALILGVIIMGAGVSFRAACVAFLALMLVSIFVGFFEFPWWSGFAIAAWFAFLLRETARAWAS
jgi:hypothetical protein